MRRTLWISAALALAVFATAFLVEAGSEGFTVLIHAAELPPRVKGDVGTQLVLTLVIQAAVVGLLHYFLYLVDARVRLDHLALVVVFIWGSLTWPLAIFGTAYREAFPETGTWTVVLYLSLVSVPVIPLVLAVVICREMLAATRARSAMAPR